MLKIQITENILKVLLNSLLCSVMFSDVGDTIGLILVFKVIGGNFLCSSVSKESACNTGDSFNFWVWKIPWRRKWQPTPVLLPGEPHGQRSPAGYNGASKVGHDLATKPPCIQTEFVYIGQVTAYLINAIKDIFNINNIT